MERMHSAPFFLPTPFGPVPLPQPPEWLAQEAKQRIVLLLNHVLQQEPLAMERISRQKGQIARMESTQFAIDLVATPAGLLDLAEAGGTPALTVTVDTSNPLALMQTLLRGDKPKVDIQGDVMLAAEVNWLVDHVRWDLEEDLARIVGDAPAHALMGFVRQAMEAIKRFAPMPQPAAHDAFPEHGA
jgi:ubiquinone biosynthesis accessory factor UbiJ